MVLLFMLNENVPVSVVPSDFTLVNFAPLNEKIIFAPAPSLADCPLISAKGTSHQAGATLPKYPPLPQTAGTVSSHAHSLSVPPVRKPHSGGTGKCMSSTFTDKVLVISEPSGFLPVKMISLSPLTTIRTVSVFLWVVPTPKSQEDRTGLELFRIILLVAFPSTITGVAVISSCSALIKPPISNLSSTASQLTNAKVDSRII